MAQEKERTAWLRTLNDQFRKAPWHHGLVVLTPGVEGNGMRFATQALNAVRAFNAFTEGNDPHGEHDFGSFELDGETVFWKIDCYEKGSDHEAGAQTPENALTTDRVLTIMLAEEY